jgi:hypothetical protein
MLNVSNNAIENTTYINYNASSTTNIAIENI